MSENLASLLTVVGTSVVLALVLHRVFERPVVASVASGVLTSLAVHAYWTLGQGYFDGWFFISFFTVGALASGIGLAVGLALEAFRARHRRSD